MKKESIKKHLKPYSIHQERRTTIDNAFASALAPREVYDEKKLDSALQMLGQKKGRELRCVYCDKPAETWDHLFGLVQDRRSSGYGHTIGNLVPCCKACNSKKGNRAWMDFVESNVNKKRKQAVKEIIKKFVKKFSHEPRKHMKEVSRKHAAELKKLDVIKETIFKAMKKADKIIEKMDTK